MRDPFRLRLMKALTDALKGITVGAGYNFDLCDYDDADERPRERVFRGRTIFGTDDPTPMLCVLEDPRPEESDNGSDGRAAVNVFRVIIQGFVDGSVEHPLDAAYRLSADVVTCISKLKQPDAPGPLRIGKRVTAITIGSPVHRPGKDDVSDVAYMLVGVRFTLVEKLDEPYE